MEWLKNITNNIWLQGLIISGLIMMIVFIIGMLLFLIKPSSKRKSIKYIYSFATGFILITAIIGQFVTAREKLNNFYNGKSNTIINEKLEIFVSFLIIFLGVVIGAMIALLIHNMFKKFNKHKDHNKMHNHDHSLDHDYDLLIHGHSKLPGIAMLLTHRFPAGLAIGGLLYNSNNIQDNLSSLLALVAFIIHVIPELVIVYFGLLDSGKSRRKTLLYSSLAKIAILPGIFLGILFGKITQLEAMFWFQPLIFIIVGTLLVWGVVLELVPEFIHHKGNSKAITSMSCVFMAGITFSLFIQFIYTH